MNDLERILLEHSDMEVHILSSRDGLPWYIAVLRNDAGDVGRGAGSTIERALANLESEAARAFALEADVWPG